MGLCFEPADDVEPALVSPEKPVETINTTDELGMG